MFLIPKSMFNDYDITNFLVNNQICRIGLCCVFLLFYVLCMCSCVFTVLYCLIVFFSLSQGRCKCWQQPFYIPVLGSHVCHYCFIMVARWNRADHYIFILFLSSSFFFFIPRLISAVEDWMSTILPHIMWP